MILGNHVTALFSASSPRAAMNSSKPVDSWKWCQFSKNSENSQHYLWQSAWNISYKIQNPDWDLCLLICQYCQKENYLKNKLAKHVRGKRPTLFRNKLVFWLPDLIRNGLTTYPIFWDMNCFFQLEKYINLISSCQGESQENKEKFHLGNKQDFLVAGWMMKNWQGWWREWLHVVKLETESLKPAT